VIRPYHISRFGRQDRADYRLIPIGTCIFGRWRVMGHRRVAYPSASTIACIGTTTSDCSTTSPADESRVFILRRRLSGQLTDSSAYMRKQSYALVVVAVFAVALAMRTIPLYWSPLPSTLDSFAYAAVARDTLAAGQYPISSNLRADLFAICSFLCVHR